MRNDAVRASDTVRRHPLSIPERPLIAVGPLKVKVQLFCGDLHAMGPGKADLLEAIGREGSVPAAGRALGMGYRKCRMLVDRMNCTWVGPLVETHGAGRRQGARLTDLGREVVAGFRDLERQIGHAAAGDEQLAFLQQRLLTVPRARD